MPAGFLGLDGAFLFGAGAAGGSAGGGVGAGRRMSNKPPIILPHTGSSSPSGAGGGGGVVDFFGMAQFPVQRHHSAVLSPCDVSRSWRGPPRMTEHPLPGRARGAASRRACTAAGAERWLHGDAGPGAIGRSVGSGRVRRFPGLSQQGPDDRIQRHVGEHLQVPGRIGRHNLVDIQEVLAERAVAVPGAFEKLRQLILREKAERLVAKLGRTLVARQGGDERFDKR